MAAEPSPPAVLLIVWWSATGATRRMALAAALGARDAVRDAAPDAAGDEAGDRPRDAGATNGAPPAHAGAPVRPVQVRLLDARRAGLADVLAAHAYIFATPEMLGSMSGMLKDFFDRTYYGALERVAGRPFASIVCAGSDGAGAVRQLARIATGWRLREVAEPLVTCTHAQTPAAILARKRLTAAELGRARALGEAMAAALSMGIW